MVCYWDEKPSGDECGEERRRVFVSKCLSVVEWKCLGELYGEDLFEWGVGRLVVVFV
jgi:hypothetical protein